MRCDAAYHAALVCVWSCAQGQYTNKRWRPSWRDEEFEQESYAKWACFEIIKALGDNKSIPPLQVLEEFQSKMGEYATIKGSSSHSNYMFSVAYDTAQWVIDMLIK